MQPSKETHSSKDEVKKASKDEWQRIPQNPRIPPILEFLITAQFAQYSMSVPVPIFTQIKLTSCYLFRVRQGVMCLDDVASNTQR